MIWMVIAILVTALIAGYIGYSLGKPSQPAQPVQPAKITGRPTTDSDLESLVRRDYSRLPTLVVTAYNYSVVLEEAQRLFAYKEDGSCSSRTLYAEPLVEGPEDIREYFVLDVRPPADYAAGHIQGATNIPACDLFRPENLARLPKDKPILVVCVTGTNAALATNLLNQLGYDAWQLRFGMTSWRETSSTAVWSKNSTHNQDVMGGNYPTVK